MLAGGSAEFVRFVVVLDKKLEPNPGVNNLENALNVPEVPCWGSSVFDGLESSMVLKQESCISHLDFTTVTWPMKGKEVLPVEKLLQIGNKIEHYLITFNFSSRKMINTHWETQTC